MANAPATFSESWYRIATQRLSLRPGVRVRRQNFRGERWIVLENPFSNQYFRLRPAAYEFVARLRSDRTVQEVWQECIGRFPDEAPGQQAVIQLLSQLYFANLLQYDLAADSAQLFERFKQRRQREVRARWMNIMFMRFPLLDPDEFLVRTLPVVGRFISGLGALLWLFVVGWALKVVADNFPALQEQSQSVLAPDNLFLLYGGLIAIKTLHEFGHAYFCRKFGGEVHVMGVLLMIFTPVPYMDATSSWGFRSRRQRMLVGAAGMIVEVFFAAIAVFVWANTGPGTVHTLAYNIMFIASVSTIVFNINPLLRFDGYYILSDWLDIPNLHQRSIQHLKHLAEKYLFGIKQSESPTQSRTEATWLTVFGISSGIYRVFVFGAILLLVADRFLLLGMLMAAVCAISWLVVPTGKFIHYLASSPKLERQRHRAISISAGMLLGLLCFLQFVPFPKHFRAPGVIQAQDRTEVITGAGGYVMNLLAEPGKPVRMGQPLLRMSNQEAELELAKENSRALEIQARLLQAMQTNAANLRPLQGRLVASSNKIAKLESDLAALTVTARHAGIWVAPHLEDFVGRWVARGTPVGLLIDPAAFRFMAAVPQEEVAVLFAPRHAAAEIRLFGQGARTVAVSQWRVIPDQQRNLPSAALGWLGGGEIAVASDDPQGRKTVEPFFSVEARIDQASPVALWDGHVGRIRFALEPEPLLPRWIQRFRQLLQKRYQV